MSAAEELKAEALAQIAAVENLYRALLAKHVDSVWDSDVTADERAEFNAMCLSAIERIAGKQHAYCDQAHAVIAPPGHGIGSSMATGALYGIVKALKRDVEANHLARLSEIEHADLFADFIEMGHYLLEQGYKDPAAVLIGGVLEEHLRQLSAKHGVPVSDVDGNGTPVPRKAERMNAELAKSVYSKLDQKTVTAWLDLRNKAAHAKYSEYDKAQVELFSEGLRFFLLRYPA